MASVNATTFGEPLVSLHHKSGPASVQGVEDTTDHVQPTPYRLQKELESLSLQEPRPTIFRVHRALRNTNEEAYEPRYISIGPYHHSDKNLEKMKIHKLRYLKSLLDRQGKSIQQCLEVIDVQEADQARRCYEEPIDLKTPEFREMLVLDACFIIEFAERNLSGRSREGDPIFTMPWLAFYITLDLILFENQVPLIVICKLYDLIFGPLHRAELMQSLLKLFEDLYPVKANDPKVASPAVKHLLELIYKSFTDKYDDQPDNAQKSTDGKANPGEIFIKSAATLDSYNVTFVRTEKDDNMFEITFKEGRMQLPHLRIQDTTESFWRNLIAYEQYFLNSRKCYFTDLAIFLDRLVNTADDVTLLMKHKIIENCLGSEEAVAQMFNKLTDNVMLSPCDCFIYQRQFKELSKYCGIKNEQMAKLKRNHLSSPWTIIPIFAAILLIGLTFLQTVFTVKE